MKLTYKQLFNKKYKYPTEKSHSIEDISKITGYKLSGLQTIFNKGIGAYKTNRSSIRPQVKSPEQWAFGRIYAAVNENSKAYKIDKVHLEKK